MLPDINPLLLTDSYKCGHLFFQNQVANNKFEFVQSNFTNRGSRIDEIQHVVHFGLQAYLTELVDLFDRNFFSRDKDEVVEEYEKTVAPFMSPDPTFVPDTKHIEDLHDLGYLPLEFKSVPEGTLVPTKVPSLVFTNTVSGYGYLVNYFETLLSTALWQPQTTATTAHYLKRKMDKAAEATSDHPEGTSFQLHDFSFRGMSSWSAAAQSGAGHLLSFLGSDMVPAVAYVNEYYPGDNGLVAASVPATEHSIMVLNGREGESETYKRLIENATPGTPDNPAILSVVSDTYNLWNVIQNILPKLDHIVRERNLKIVVRPDSGVPENIICGDPNAEEGSPENKGVIQLLHEQFGSDVNSKGYLELNPNYGAIYGDSINPTTIENVFRRLREAGFASTNIVFGAGSFLYNGAFDMEAIITRDTYNSAIKSTWAQVDGEGVNLLKDPITDSGTKKSATGRLAVLPRHDGTLYLQEKATPEQEKNSMLKPVFRDGEFLKTWSFAEVRSNLNRNTEILERAGEL